jgi:transposase InsO family protein
VPPWASAQAPCASGSSGSARKAWPVYKTDPRGRTGCAARRRPIRWRVSKACGASAGPGRRLARATGVSKATVSRILYRLGLNRLRALEPVEPVRRYQRDHPGDLIHIDIKKLGRIDGIGHRITGERRGQSNRRSRGQGLGWEFVHVCIDDASRIAFAQIMPDEKKESAIAFLKGALDYYQSLGVTVVRVMTDNGGCYKAFDFRDVCRDLGLKHIRTKPYTPKTNGKAERFIQSALREWAYAQAYPHSRRRTAELPRWLHRYNWHRPHARA